MKKIGFQSLCVAAAIACLLICPRLKAGENLSGRPDPAIDAFADEIAQITMDGAQHGFKAAHFRRYAATVRTLDACLEQRGVHKDFDRKLEEEGLDRIDPGLIAQVTAQYWKKRGIGFEQKDLAMQLSIDTADLRELRKAIKKAGGSRSLLKAVAYAFEKKAKDSELHAVNNPAFLREGAVRIPGRGSSFHPGFIQVQEIGSPDASILSDPAFTAGIRLECLCAMLLAGGVALSNACASGECEICCPLSALMIAMSNFLEAFHVCSANGC